MCRNRDKLVAFSYDRFSVVPMCRNRDKLVAFSNDGFSVVRLPLGDTPQLI